MASSFSNVLKGCVLSLVVIALSGCGGGESRTKRLLRQATLENPRPIEGRLSVTDRFARWVGPPGVPRQDSGLIFDGADQQVLRGSRSPLGQRDPDELHRLGLLLLHHGAAARAVSAFEAVVEQSPSAAVLSDLSAAYLALAEDDHPWLQVDAIAAATRAIEQAPDETFAAFNLALSLERMSLVHEASLAWERYLTLEDDSRWRNEALERLARLREPTTRSRWQAEKKRAISAAMAGDPSTLARLTRQFPSQIKELLELDLLPALADPRGSANGKAQLIAAKQIATILARSGERLYLDAIGAIESQPDLSRVLEEGHRAFARGQGLRGDCSQAMPLFERAFKNLTAGSSPMAWSARLEQLVCVYRRRSSDAEGLLAELASELEGHPYPTLLAKIEAMRGLCAMVAGRHSQAIPHYERAVQLLTGIGAPDIARLQGMLDEAYRFLGDRDAAWRYRLAALQGAVAEGNRQVRHAVLAVLARDLIEADRREAAQAVLNEMLANARTWSEYGAEAEALLRRIQLNILAGSNDRAAADIAVCSRLLGHFQQSADREHLETELMIVSAEQRLAVDPAEALQLILTAVPRLESSEDGLLMPRALLDLARARASLGENEAAQEAFDRALLIYETRREDTAEERLQISFFSTAQASFDAMIRYQALERHDGHAAFAYSERVRARALRDRMRATSEATDLFPVAQQIERIPSNVAVFAYTVLPEALLVWRLRQSSLTMYVLPARRREVADVVSSLRAALAGASSRATGEKAAARAFDMLLRPAFEGLPAETELVFMPDRELYQIPFSALFDGSRRRYLIEDHTCLVTPSLELYLESLERRASVIRKPRRVLAVGDPVFDRTQFASLPPLPYARKEALAVAALYQSSLQLVGEAATRQAILDGIPGSDVLHLGAHAVVDPRNPLDSIVATAGPDQAPLKASDLDAERLADVHLVFLAACETAPGFSDGDREGVAGLARSVLAAGVPSVVATLWAVEDRAAARLATEFHVRLLKGEAPALALRRAQLAVLSHSTSSAPFAWAPFQLFRGR